MTDRTQPLGGTQRLMMICKLEVHLILAVDICCQPEKYSSKCIRVNDSVEPLYNHKMHTYVVLQGE